MLTTYDLIQYHAYILYIHLHPCSFTLTDTDTSTHSQYIGVSLYFVSEWCFIVFKGSLFFNSLWPNDSRHMGKEIWVNIGSGNGLLPDGTKPVPEPMLIYHQ